jgi:hypothetical protein
MRDVISKKVHNRYFGYEIDMMIPVAKGLAVARVCRQSISDSWLGNLRECLAHLV